MPYILLFITSYVKFEYSCVGYVYYRQYDMQRLQLKSRGHRFNQVRQARKNMRRLPRIGLTNGASQQQRFHHRL